MGAERRQLNAELTAEAHEGWAKWADDRGLNVTVVLEVIGLWLRNGEPVVFGEKLVAEALEIQKARKRRLRR